MRPQPIQREQRLAIGAAQPGGPKPLIQHQQANSTEFIGRLVEQRVMRRQHDLRRLQPWLLRLVAARIVERADMRGPTPRDLAAGGLDDALDLHRVKGRGGIEAHQALGVFGRRVRRGSALPDHRVHAQGLEGLSLLLGQIVARHADDDLAAA
ncbi:hypothetical protein [Falsiroseomonas sp. E2-1-a4]|uniref:hypothetical protein n=1 Tax=Falsiroseomonas sp. E2-1-a4 TaxID=3239299 RepID=UPI003F3E427A